MSATNYSIKSGSQESRENTVKAIANRKPFKTSGALFGVRNVSPGVGRLPYDARERFYETVNDTVYWVVSWETPIAWYVIPDPGEAPYWIFVSRYFTKSTSVHQGVVRRGLTCQTYAVEVVK